MASAVWDGGGANANWTTAENWDGDVAPVAGQHLIFPDFAPQPNNTNDFAAAVSSSIAPQSHSVGDAPAGVTFASIRFGGQGYVLSGNPVTLTEGIVNTGFAESNEAALPITLGADASLLADSDASLIVSGEVNTAGHVLTLGGDGTFGAIDVTGTIRGDGSVLVDGDANFTLSGTNTHTGGTTVTNGVLFVNGSAAAAPATAAGSMLSSAGLGGTGTVGPVSVGDAGYLRPGAAGALGTLTASGNVTFSPESAGLELRLGGSTNQSDRLAVNGTVSPGGSLSFAELPAAGTTFVAVENDGNDAIVGAFSSYDADTESFVEIPEGGLIELEQPFGFGGTGTMLRVSYVGGDGNDLVLTTEGPGTFALSTEAVSVNEDASGVRRPRRGQRPHAPRPAAGARRDQRRRRQRPHHRHRVRRHPHRRPGQRPL